MIFVVRKLHHILNRDVSLKTNPACESWVLGLVFFVAFEHYFFTVAGIYVIGIKRNKASFAFCNVFFDS